MRSRHELPMYWTAKTSARPRIEAADEGAGQRPHATDDDDGQALELDGRAHPELGGVDVHREERAGDRAEGRRDGEGRSP